MQFKDIRQTARATSDLLAGVVAILAIGALSREGKVLFAWHHVERCMRVVALDVLRKTLVEHSLDEPVEDGWDSIEHDGHVHWVPQPSMLDPMIKHVKAEAEREMMAQQVREMFSSKESGGEPLDPDIFAAMFRAVKVVDDDEDDVDDDLPPEYAPRRHHTHSDLEPCSVNCPANAQI